jgi:hypothetical protein
MCEDKAKCMKLISDLADMMMAKIAQGGGRVKQFEDSIEFLVVER